MRKLRSAVLARTAINEHAPEAEPDYRSEECCREHDAGRGTTVAAGQENRSICHGQYPESETYVHGNTPLDRLCHELTPEL